MPPVAELIQTCYWLFPASALLTLIFLVIRCTDVGRPFGSRRSSAWAIAVTIWIGALCTLAGLFVLTTPFLALPLPATLIKRRLEGSAPAGANLSSTEVNLAPEDVRDNRALSTLLGVATVGIQFCLQRLDAEMNNTIVARAETEGYFRWPLADREGDSPALTVDLPTLSHEARKFKLRLLTFLGDDTKAIRAVQREFDLVESSIMEAHDTTNDAARIDRADIEARQAYGRIRRMAYLRRYRDQGTQRVPWSRRLHLRRRASQPSRGSS